MSAGTLQHDAESAWLKFSLDGKTLIVSKKTLRHSISWEDLNAAGVVFGSQNTTITIGENTYIVRLLKGAASDPTVQGADGLWHGYDIAGAHGSEWNRLLYPIHSGVHTDANNPTTHSDPNATPFGSWASYSDAGLLVHSNFGNGSYSWTQETNGSSSTHRVFRGGFGVSTFHRSTATTASTYYGWRPALELVV